MSMLYVALSYIENDRTSATVIDINKEYNDSVIELCRSILDSPKEPVKNIKLDNISLVSYDCLLVIYEEDGLLDYDISYTINKPLKIEIEILVYFIVKKLESTK